MISSAKRLGGLLSAHYALRGEHGFTLASGIFDCVHRGHVEMLHRAKRAGGQPMLGVAVNTDDSVQRLKGKKRPICPLEDRMFMLSELEVVDFVFFFVGDTVADTLSLLRPRAWCKGGDYTLKTLNKLEVKMARKAGTKIVIIPRIGEWSTTGILKKI